MLDSWSMKKLLAIVVLGLLVSENVYAELVKSIHGFHYEMPDNYKRVNNINIEDVKKLNTNDANKRLMDAFEKQMQNIEMEYLFYKDWGGDNISMISAPSPAGMINSSNVKNFCDQNLKILENAAQKKLEGFDCRLSKYPKNSSWAVYTSYPNPFTNYPTSLFQVEFANNIKKDKRFVVGLVCGPKYCDKLTEDFSSIIESINFK